MASWSVATQAAFQVVRGLFDLGPQHQGVSNESTPELRRFPRYIRSALEFPLRALRILRGDVFCRRRCEAVNHIRSSTSDGFSK